MSYDPLGIPPTEAQLPLLVLVPERGSANALKALSASLYARFEAVSRTGRSSAELEMLRQALTWLGVSLDQPPLE